MHYICIDALHIRTGTTLCLHAQQIYVAAGSDVTECICPDRFEYSTRPYTPNCDLNPQPILSNKKIKRNNVPNPSGRITQNTQHATTINPSNVDPSLFIVSQTANPFNAVLFQNILKPKPLQVQCCAVRALLGIVMGGG